MSFFPHSTATTRRLLRRCGKRRFSNDADARDRRMSGSCGLECSTAVPVGLRAKPFEQIIDECADLRGYMTVREIHRIDMALQRDVLGEHRAKAPRLQGLADDEGRQERQS